jgi:hypothetical protein
MPLVARRQVTGWGSRQLTIDSSPRRTRMMFVVAFSHMKNDPSSEPATMYCPLLHHNKPQLGAASLIINAQALINTEITCQNVFPVKSNSVLFTGSHYLTANIHHMTAHRMGLFNRAIPMLSYYSVNLDHLATRCRDSSEETLSPTWGQYGVNGSNVTFLNKWG